MANKNLLLLVSSIFIFSSGFSSIFGASVKGLPIVKDGASPYHLVIPAKAPASVTDAANELQRDVMEATGVKLPILKDDEKVEAPFISLGETQQAKQAGITTEGLAYDAYRIVTRDGNLFILGIDTTTVLENIKLSEAGQLQLTPHPEVPGPALTSLGGFSNGTANGIYSFLEQALDVRWLFPGELGRDVPKRKDFVWEPVDQTVTPPFDYRVLGIASPGKEWMAQQKLGFSRQIHYSHNWNKSTVPTSLYDQHPDWFPMINGTRPRPPESNYKLETTNPELVRFFAEKAIAALKADPTMATFALSPSDGRGWSESPESQALYDPSPIEDGPPSMTPLVLKFYRDVAEIVAKEYPQGQLAGYLYQDFSVPPQKGDASLPKNFTPVLVGKSMGFSFYRPEVLEREAHLLNEWKKVVPENWYFYAMPTWLRESSAQVTPAAVKELNTLYHTLTQVGIKGAFIYGTFVWSQGALVNYINAKMLWDPSGDAEAIQRDWLTRAYGPEAGKVMEELYQKLDESWWSDYFRSPQSRHYNVSETLYRNTFGAHYPEMEKLFLKAWEQPMTDRQRERLDLIRQNMIALQFRLKNAGYLPKDYTSPLTKTAKEVFQLFVDPQTQGNFSYVLVSNTGISLPPFKTVFNETPPNNAQPVSLSQLKENTPVFVLHATQDGEVVLQPFDVFPGSSFMSYYLQDSKGKLLDRGFLSSEDEIRFKAKADQTYFFIVRTTGLRLEAQSRWKITIPDAAIAQGILADHTLYLNPEEKSSASAPLYVLIPEAMPLQVETKDTGVIVQTETDKVARNKALQVMRRAAADTLKANMKDAQADVVKELNQGWKFLPDPEQEGDTKGYAKQDFDDKKWKSIGTVGYWRDHGFPDYHGSAWYRITFDLTAEQTDPLAMGNRKLLLYFGAIDGDAEIYVNGIKIDSRKMMQHSNGWEQPLLYDISGAIHSEKNTIAVKVSKDAYAAGIYRGVAILEGILPEKK